VANRTEDAKLVINGNKYPIESNNGNNHLHGGNEGFHVQHWEVEPYQHTLAEQAYKLKLLSPDGHEGYPGNLLVEVVYALTSENELVIEYHAQTDKTTALSLTSHGYFNLAGVASNKNILHHELMIFADQYTPLKHNQVPTGELEDVEGTPFDFRKFKPIKDALVTDNTQIAIAGGIDHNWVLNKDNNELSVAAVLQEKVTGRTMGVYTTKPGMQVYLGMHFNPNDAMYQTGDDLVFDKFSGIALEAQYFPNAANQVNFPSIILEPEKEYRHTTVYKFGLLS